MRAKTTIQTARIISESAFAVFIINGVLCRVLFAWSVFSRVQWAVIATLGVIVMVVIHEWGRTRVRCPKCGCSVVPHSLLWWVWPKWFLSKTCYKCGNKNEWMC